MAATKEVRLMVYTLLCTLILLGGVGWWLDRLGFYPIQSLVKDRTIDNLPGESAGAGSRPSAPLEAIPAISQPQKTFAAIENVPGGLFSYGGSTVWAPVRRDIDQAIQTVFPDFELRYVNPSSEAPSSTTGVRMLLEGILDFAQTSRALTQEELQEAEKRGLKLQEVVVALDGEVAIAHPSLNIPGLTVDQFNDIFAGRIKNWQDVGGPDLPIQVYGKKDRDSGDWFTMVDTTTEAIQKIANDPAGIFWSSAALVIPQCGVKPLPVGTSADTLVAPYQEPAVPTAACGEQRNQVNIAALRSGQYPLTRRMRVVINQNGQLHQQAGEAYAALMLTDQGQSLLEQSGFVRIR